MGLILTSIQYAKEAYINEREGLFKKKETYQIGQFTVFENVTRFSRFFDNGLVFSLFICLFWVFLGFFCKNAVCGFQSDLLTT